MVSFLPAWIKGILGFTLWTLNTAFWCVFIYIVAVFKLIIPINGFRKVCTDIMIVFAEIWIDGNGRLTHFLHKIRFDIQGVEGLDRNASYLVCANHQSWIDITFLQYVFNRRIPFMRFFLKKELMYVPFLGIAWWALDFPFMQRFSKEYLEKHPDMRGKDLETTRKACAKFQGSRISIINFLEGTRFTKAKHDAQKSPYKNLLKPKTGGIAFVIDAMGPQFKSLLDVTLFYPEGARSLWELFSGRVNEVVVRVRQLEIPQDMLGGNYLEDEAYRERLQEWLRTLWKEKDDLLSELAH
ncbi:MAG TPA: acyltransferase [Bdellovibrionales bacterium]|jgi:1-acyl-sn-glycerol-3-phosphate acyltransferase|nr:acyltransferase [Bdellovibrionales bacterium]